MAPAMAAGVAPAHTSVQPVQHDDYGSAPGTGQYRTGGAPERPLPPPREAEQPKRNPTGPILVVVAGIAVLIVAMFLLKPWDKSDDTDRTAGEDTGTSAADDQTEANTEAAEETGGDSEENADEDNSDNNGDNEEENTDDATTEEEPEVVEVDDYSGWDVNDALTDLEEQGYTAVFTETTAPESSDHETCEVLYQDPEGGTEVGYDTPITLQYVANDDSCPDGVVEY
jgi:eukaryotic-like serine/threonine-protein kinase